MTLAIACALLMSVPVLAGPENSIACDNDVISASVGQPADATLATAPGHATAIQAPACTTEAASTDSFGALPACTFSDTASDGTQQRLEVAARTRAEIG